MDNINQTRNTTVKIENDLKYVKEPKDSKLSPMSSSKQDDAKEKTILTNKTTLNEPLNENLASISNSSSVEQTSSNNGSLNDTNVASANPEVRQRRLQHFQTNTASQ